MKKIPLLIFSLFMSIGWGQCSGCNTLFNFCNEILDNYNFCSPIDIDILEEIVVLNNLDIELVDLGYQEWVSGRLKNFILITKLVKKVSLLKKDLSITQELIKTLWD